MAKTLAAHTHCLSSVAAGRHATMFSRLTLITEKYGAPKSTSAALAASVLDEIEGRGPRMVTVPGLAPQSTKTAAARAPATTRTKVASVPTATATLPSRPATQPTAKIPVKPAARPATPTVAKTGGKPVQHVSAQK